METLKITQYGKIGVAARYRFYYEKIWNITITANSPKPGECSYTAESLGKTPTKPQHPPARVYGLTCGSVRLYNCVQNPYSLYDSCT